jgi:hypothetical protein
VKRRALGVFLLLFALWPLGHFALARRYEIDPWKLFGWAMYCAPGPMKTVRVVGLGPQRELRRFDMRRYTPEERALVDGFRERRRALGRLARPEALARGMLALHPELEGVVVAVFALELDRETARLRSTAEQSTHWRDGRSEPFALSAELMQRLFESP